MNAVKDLIIKLQKDTSPESLASPISPVSVTAITDMLKEHKIETKDMVKAAVSGEIIKIKDDQITELKDTLAKTAGELHETREALIEATKKASMFEAMAKEREQATAREKDVGTQWHALTEHYRKDMKEGASVHCVGCPSAPPTLRSHRSHRLRRCPLPAPPSLPPLLVCRPWTYVAVFMKSWN